MKNTLPDERSQAKLLYANAVRYDSHWQSIPYPQPCTELFFVTGGKGSFFLQNLVYPVGQGDLIIINTGLEHTETSDRISPLEYIVLGVEGLEVLSPQPDTSGWTAVNLFGIGADLTPYLHTIVREMEQKDPGFQFICQGLLEVILALLIRHFNFTFTLADRYKKSNWECTLVRRYIDTHFKENLSLDQLATLAHVNKYYLVHTFTREYGTSPISYLISRRIQESRQLLESTNYSLSQIAHMLGFSSPSYFSQVFRKQMGSSPLEYRKRHKMRQKKVEEQEQELHFYPYSAQQPQPEKAGGTSCDPPCQQLPKKSD